MLTIARSGFADMAPALRRAFNRDPDDDRLERLFGAAPRVAIAVSIAAGIALGSALESWLDRSVLTEHINFSAVLIGAAYALLLRRYLFASGQAREGDFAWLAAPLIPAAAALVGVAFVERLVHGIDTLAGAPAWTSIGGVLAAFADTLAVAAGLTIAVASLCYSKDWGAAVKDLVQKLLVFKITVYVMVLLIVEIGIVGPLLGGVLEGLLGIRFPGWLGDFVDQVSYASLMTIIYLAVIGAAWTACRQSFGELLESGHADILKTIEAMAEPPEARDKRLRREAAKQSKRDKRRNKRAPGGADP